MEVLRCILKEKSLLPDFNFHWKCGSTKLVNLCFADDLMTFCKGEVSSITHITQSLTEFEALSGLSPSSTKSNIFFSEVNPSTKASILNILGFQEAKTNPWTHRYLSYASRIQLILSIVISMQTYWSSLFIIPKKGKSFWSVKTPCDPSWVWRKLLNLRSVVQAHIKYKIGDDQSTSLWFDNWNPLGPLLPRFGPRVIYDLGLPKDFTVKDIIRSNHWAFPLTQSPDLNEIRSELQAVPINDSIEDSCTWTLTAFGEESHEHLFFECPMATLIRGILSIKTPHMVGLATWQQWVNRLSNFKGKSLAITIVKLVFIV
ncbi:uncharacterized protein LOC131317369 [Rhododendron vialii]|uniref:uncharacterized protein LOC131317369 n=1 Tax=Rhododendron vialii TaxID=182163 RepID=UPI00265FEBD0|nr:uncharacterized protein LOC131317369 [Rhododendron vialii]